MRQFTLALNQSGDDLANNEKKREKLVGLPDKQRASLCGSAELGILDRVVMCEVNNRNPER